MRNTRTQRSLAVTTVLLTVAALASCAGAPSSDKADDGVDEAAAKRFVTCLEGEGQTAKILEGGMVGLLLPDDGTTGAADDSASISLDAGDGASVGMSMVFADEDGTWMAATEADAYPEEGGQREAWSTCEEEVPEFEQPAPDMAGVEAMRIDPEEMIAAGLEFASCARENGFTDFADPDSEGMLELPAGFTEDEARSLLEACTDPDDETAMPPMVSMESVEALDFDWWALIGEFFEGSVMSATTLPAEGSE
ncbi:hypothetical protein [Microbacterium maritypicum]